ncbi:hypothetical protein PRVXT_001971 [Proteinivorax tanatarense]|uniref:Mur ligase central domain-containing protein n=1 Tax=Proteinivorax tanatarense TaxID=1260629 RepID=A0AAU7VIP6_9FIRM
MSIENSIDIIYSFYNKIGEKIPLDYHDSQFRSPCITRKLLSISSVDSVIDRNIIVIGSKGKGSTAEILGEILKRHSIKVGLFKSPHLIDFKERIQVDGEKISSDDLNRIVKALEKNINAVGNSIKPPKYLGPNGIMLVAALKYFNENKTQLNILEAGRGGLYDDTYKMGKKIIFTPIFKEHKYRLGNSLEEISQTKIKAMNNNTTHAVISKQVNSMVHRQFKKQATKFDIKTKEFNKDFVIRNDESTTKLKIDSKRYNLQFPPLPQYITENFVTATVAAKFLGNVTLNESTLNSIANNLKLPGRCEVIKTPTKTLLFDGMVSSESAKEVSTFLDKLHMHGKKACLLALPKDKDLNGVIEQLADKFDLIILTETTQTQYPFDNKKFYGTNLKIIPNPQKAIKYIEDNDILNICVFGTQSLLGEIKKVYQNT